MLSAFALILVRLATTYVRAEPSPTSPGPGDVFFEAGPCAISWDIDRTGNWKNMTIDLMSGDNFNMIFLTSVATGLDGTNPSKNMFSYTCPQVTPHAPIYFYQFGSPLTSNKTWTGRFTITDSVNDIVEPSDATQPSGDEIPWGTGSLVHGSTSASASVPASPPIVGQVAHGAPGGAGAGARTRVSSTSSLTPGSHLPSSHYLGTPTQSAVHVTFDAAAASSAVAASGENGAVAALSFSYIFRTGLALVLAAFGFAMMF